MLQKAFALRWILWRRLLITRLALQARLVGATVSLQVAEDVRVSPRVRFDVQSGSSSSVAIGPGCRIHDGVLVLLKGGSLELGVGVEIRRGTVINLSGSLSLQGHNIISYSNVIHCAEAIVLEPYASTNEFVSIIDSTHHHDGARGFFYENVTTAPIRIGANAWICNKASVLMGVNVGANSVVASHAVVNRDIPECVVAGGLPARVLAERPVGPAARELAERAPRLRTRGASHDRAQDAEGGSAPGPALGAERRAALGRDAVIGA